MRYLILMVRDVVSSVKVVLNSTCPLTSTWSPVKPYKQPSYDLNWSGDNSNLLKVDQNITSVELPWSMRTWCTLC